MSNTKSFSLDQILTKACRQEKFSPGEIGYLLERQESSELDLLFSAARHLRRQHFQNKVFLYGFLYFSTWCRNDCTFCYYRRSNDVSKRYRKSEEEILEAALELTKSGVHLLDLTLGEDPVFFHRENGFGYLAELIKKVKVATNLPIMISPGVVPENVLKLLSEAGADWYACYQETHNEELFRRLRTNQSYEARLASKKHGQMAGLLVEEGIMVGIGETTADIAHSLENMENIKAHQVRVMSFVPQPGTPLENALTPPRTRELAVIAVLRLLFPDRLIPASLDVDGVEGLQARINAGANVITSLIPPELGLAGVAQNSKDIKEGHRTVFGVLPLLEEMGMQAATVTEYKNWLETEKRALKRRYQEA